MLRRGLLGGLARMGANPTTTLALAKRSQTYVAGPLRFARVTAWGSS
jgi:hypothetical protein